MIKIIAAIDTKRGLANDQGIPWNLPSDKTYYRNLVKNDEVIMGSGTYHEFRAPLSKRINFVANPVYMELKPGFARSANPRDLLVEYRADPSRHIWNIGGAGLFGSTLELADELYLTLIDGDFGCTKFFPKYEDKFECVDPGTPMQENGLNFRFTIWRPKH